MTSPYCATCSSPRLRQSWTRILPLKTALPVLYWILKLTLTLTLLHLLSQFSALVKPNFVVLPRWALWGHPQSSCNYSAEPHIKNLQTRKIVCRWNISLHIHHCGDLLPILVLYDKIRQLEPGNSDVIIWKIPSVKFVIDSAKVALPSSGPLIEPATSVSSPIFRTHPHGYNFFIRLYPYGIGPATGKCASFLFNPFLGDYDNLL